MRLFLRSLSGVFPDWKTGCGFSLCQRGNAFIKLGVCALDGRFYLPALWGDHQGLCGRPWMLRGIPPLVIVKENLLPPFQKGNGIKPPAIGRRMPTTQQLSTEKGSAVIRITAEPTASPRGGRGQRCASQKIQAASRIGFFERAHRSQPRALLSLVSLSSERRFSS